MTLRDTAQVLREVQASCEMKQPPTELSRVQPVPEVDYASPAATRPRTHSGFGLASLLIGSSLFIAVLIAAVRMLPWSLRDGDRLAAAAVPVCIVGAAFGIVGLVRRSKRRMLGGVGLLVNVAVGVAVAWLWFVIHVPA